VSNYQWRANCRHAKKLPASNDGKFYAQKNCIAEKFQRLANSHGFRPFLETVKSKYDRKTSSADTMKSPVVTALHAASPTAKSVQKTRAINGVPGIGSAIDFMALMP
jgi:hypothetical protein